MTFIRVILEIPLWLTNIRKFVWGVNAIICSLPNLWPLPNPVTTILFIISLFSIISNQIRSMNQTNDTLSWYFDESKLWKVCVNVGVDVYRKTVLKLITVDYEEALKLSGKNFVSWLAKYSKLILELKYYFYHIFNKFNRCYNVSVQKYFTGN